MSSSLCIIIREDYDTGKQSQMDKKAFAVWLQSKMQSRGLSNLELERLSGVPDATIGRILSCKVDEVRASVIGQLAKGLEEPFWKAMQAAGFTQDDPMSLSEQAAALATTLEDQPDLMKLMQEVAGFDLKDRDAVLAYMEDLRRRHDRQERNLQRRRQKKPRSSEAN